MLQRLIIPYLLFIILSLLREIRYCWKKEIGFAQKMKYICYPPLQLLLFTLSSPNCSRNLFTGTSGVALKKRTYLTHIDHCSLTALLLARNRAAALLAAIVPLRDFPWGWQSRKTKQGWGVTGILEAPPAQGFLSPDLPLCYLYIINFWLSQSFHHEIAFVMYIFPRDLYFRKRFVSLEICILERDLNLEICICILKLWQSTTSLVPKEPD